MKIEESLLTVITCTYTAETVILQNDIVYVCLYVVHEQVVYAAEIPGPLAGSLLHVHPLQYHIPYSCGQVYIGETKWRLEARLLVREHRDACERGMMEKLAVVEYAWENHHPINRKEALVLDRARGQGERYTAEGGPVHPDDTHREVLQQGWRAGDPGLLDRIDEETGGEGQSLLTFDLQ